MKIYRIQDKEGRGPWKPGFSHKWVQSRKDHKNLIPWMFEFGPVHLDAFSWEHVGCGCSDIKALRRWINEKEYKILLSFGYQAVELKANRVLGKSKIQCLFTKKEPLKDNAIPFDLYDT